MAAPVIFERSRDELGLVRWNGRQNGNTSGAGEKRTMRGSVRPKQIERKFLCQPFRLGLFCDHARAPQYSCEANAAVELGEWRRGYALDQRLSGAEASRPGGRDRSRFRLSASTFL